MAIGIRRQPSRPLTTEEEMLALQAALQKAGVTPQRIGIQQRPYTAQEPCVWQHWPTAMPALRPDASRGAGRHRPARGSHSPHRRARASAH